MKKTPPSPSNLLLYILPFIFLLHPTPSFSLLNPIDFLALQYIKKSMYDLNGSNFFTSWDFTSDPCSFNGVTCQGEDDHVHVVQLNLGEPRAGSPGLSGRIPLQIGNLTYLQELAVLPGRVFGSIPFTISSLTNLQFLAITGNYISGTIPSLTKLSSLQTLDLSHNILTGPLPTSFPNLIRLVLSHNHLSGSIPSFSNPSPRLTWIDLSHNSLTGDVVGKLPPSMEFLSLSWNNLTGSAGEVLGELNLLRYVDLNSNKFTGVIPGKVFGLPLLRNLELRGNGFYGVVKPVDVVEMDRVDLSFNGFWGEVSPMLSGVVELYMGNNKFSGRVPGMVVDGLNKGIRILYLQHNYLTGMDGDTVNLSSPLSASLCLRYNCMVPPPAAMSCPPHAGVVVTRPLSQCRNLH